MNPIKRRIFLLALLLSLTSSSVLGQSLVVYGEVPGRAPSDHYLCRVKLASEGDGAWRESFVMQTIAKDALGYYDILRGWTASWIAFEGDFASDAVVVEIAKKDGSPITEAMVRPVGDASAATIANGKAYVTFSEPGNVNVDINGQLENTYTGHGYTGPDVHTISLFANPIYRRPNEALNNVRVLQPGEAIATVPRAEWDTLVFAPGVHEIDIFEIHSNEALFIPGDAVVKGNIHPKNAWRDNASQHFTVYGSGTISGEDIVRHPDDTGLQYKPFTYQGEGALLEGFVVADPAFHTFNMGHSRGGTENPNVYRNLKILAWRVNSDGVNAFRNSEVSGCFFRVQDDAFYLGREHVNQHDNVVWTDANGAVLFLQDVADGSTCTFSDVKVIYARAQWHWWNGGRVVSMRELAAGERGQMSNVHVKNILVEDPLPAFPPFYMRMIGPDGQYSINNVVIENVRQEHAGVSSDLDQDRGKPRNTMLGLDADRRWENILYKNCYYNGTNLTSFADGDFLTEFVDETTVLFQFVEPQSIALEGCPLVGLEPEEELQLTATLLPADAGSSALGWSSSAPTVVGVDETGRLTALSAGTATITASVDAGAVAASCQVTVFGPTPNKLHSVVAPTTVSAGEVVTLQVQVDLPEQKDVVVDFELMEDPFTSYGTQRVTLPAGAATHPVSVQIDATTPTGQDVGRFYVMVVPVGGGYADRFQDIAIDNVDVLPPLGANLAAAAQVTMYPNPAEDRCTIRGNSPIRSLTVTSLSGLQLFTATPQENSYELPLAGYAPGMYLVTVYTSVGQATTKLIIK